MMKYLGLPLLASEHGAQVDKFILYIHYLMGVLFVGWLAYFFYTVYRFRASAHPKASYAGAQSHASTYVEGAVAIIEGVLLVGLAIPLWANFADDFPKASEATVIRVVAAQFSWTGVYPGKDGEFGKQDFALVNSTNQFGWDYSDPLVKDNFTGPLNTITVPEGKPVITHITSKDVIHSFKINSFRVTQDAIPGLSIPIWFNPTAAGSYMINCAQLCGGSHFFMKGLFNVVPQAKFDEFVAANSAGAATSAQGFE